MDPLPESAARRHLRERLRALEAVPGITKTRIKASILADHTIDWVSLRREHRAAGGPGRTPVNWKMHLVSALLVRRFPHGGARARRRAGRPTGGPLDRLLDGLPHAELQRVLLRLLQRLTGAADPPAPAPAGPPPPLALFLRRRHIQRWNGFQCLSTRLVLEDGAPPRDDAQLREGCARVWRWWQRAGRQLSHVRGRPANRLTAGLDLVYTDLPPAHPLEAHVRAHCDVEEDPPPRWTPAGRPSTGRGGASWPSSPSSWSTAPCGARRAPPPCRTRAPSGRPS